MLNERALRVPRKALWFSVRLEYRGDSVAGIPADHERPSDSSSSDGIS
jgi:hypothetical protein